MNSLSKVHCLFRHSTPNPLLIFDEDVGVDKRLALRQGTGGLVPAHAKMSRWASNESGWWSPSAQLCVGQKLDSKGTFAYVDKPLVVMSHHDRHERGVFCQLEHWAA